MRRIKNLLLGVLALGCMALGACGETETYTVTLMEGSTVIDTVEKDKATHLEAPKAPEKKGYTFKGWYTDEALTVPYNPDILSANLTLYAKYEANTLFVSLNVGTGATSGVEGDRLAVTYGQTYTLPTPTKEGYTFTGWTLDGEEFPATGTYDRVGAVRVTANWTINVYTVTLKDGETTLSTQSVEYGKTATTWNSPAPGYEVVGIYSDAEMTTAYDFATLVKADTTLYVKFAPKTFEIKVNEADTDTTAVFGADYTVAEPVREGYIFQGYKKDGEDFPLTGKYTFTENIVITAIWEKDPTFNKSTVSFYDGAVELSSYRKVVENGTELSDLVDAPSKKGYTFAGWYNEATFDTAFVDGTAITDDVKLYAKYTANTYHIDVDFNGGTWNGDATYADEIVYGTTYELPANPVRNEFKFLGYTAVIGGQTVEFPATGTYEYDHPVSVKANWKSLVADADEEGEELFLQKSTYFKERQDVEDEFTFVFVTGMTYNFSTLDSIQVLNAGSAVTADGKQLTMNTAIDQFKVQITKTVEGTSITYTRKAKIVDQIASANEGADYLSAWGGDETALKAKRSAFLNVKADAIMTVGATNFKPDVAIKTLNNQVLSFEKAYANVTVTADGEPTTAFTMDANGVVNFDASLVGKTVTLTFTPKYALTKASVSLTVKVNNGVNVYTNAELKTAYGDRATSEINILRNIKAEIGAEDYVAGTNRPINQYEYGVYKRNVASTTDKVTVNGNFFAIDGSGLPIAHNGVDGRKWAVAGTSGYYLTDTQIGLFQYYNRYSEKEYLHNGQVTFNDLYISGNADMSDAAKKEPYEGKEWLVYSGSYHGIVVRGATLNVNNATITQTNISVFADGGISVSDNTQQAVQIKLDYAKLDDNWGNQVYMYDHCKLDVTNSYLGNCGGAAIHVDDKPKTTTENPNNLNVVVNVDTATVMENYVAGTETWFMGQGAAPVAGEMKGSVEGGILQATTTAKGFGYDLPETTILKLSEQDQSVQLMNFVFLVRQKGETSEWASDANGKAYVKHNLPIYMDMEVLQKALAGQAQLTDAIFPQNAPAGQRSFVRFSTTLVDGSYVVGFVEVQLGANKMKP